MIPVLTPAEMAAVDARRPGAGRGAHRAVPPARWPASRSTCWDGSTGGGSWWSPDRATTATTDGSPASCCGRGVARHGASTRSTAPARAARPADLVIDAAFGTGFRGELRRSPTPTVHRCWRSTSPRVCRVSTGEVVGPPGPSRRPRSPSRRSKPGLLCRRRPGVRRPGRGRRHRPRRLVRPDPPGEPMRTCVAWVPARRAEDHKWRHAVWVRGRVARHDRCCPPVRARRRCGAAPATSGSPRPGDRRTGRPDRGGGRTRRRSTGGPRRSWRSAGGSRRSRRPRPGAVGASPRRQVRELVAGLDRPLVLDGDALSALGPDVVRDPDRAGGTDRAHPPRRRVRAAHRRAARAGPDRRRPAAWPRRTGATVLLKGPTTVVADPTGEC